MKDLLIRTLETLGYPVYLQGSLNESEPYPASFFTFWNNASDDLRHYDNRANAFVWDFDVNFYSNDPALVQSVPLAAKAALRRAGFIIGGRGFDLPSGVESHTGRGINAIIIENNTEEE